MNKFRHILLVEDDEKDIELTLTTLEEYNLANKTIVVRDGAEALDYLYCRNKYSERSSGNPVVILLDLKMPKVNGIEVLKVLKNDNNKMQIPIVVLSSSNQSIDLEECYHLGVNSYVVKPVRFEDFVEAVKQIGIFWALINEPPFE